MSESARHTDPDSSHTTVRSITADSKLEDKIIALAAESVRVFDDWDLTIRLRKEFGETWQRNVVARARGLIEKRGTITRTGEYRRDHPHCPPNRKYMHFKYTPGGEPPAPTDDARREAAIRVRRFLDEYGTGNIYTTWSGGHPTELQSDDVRELL